MKVSIDFDGTLDNIKVQEFVQELMSMNNIEVHVVTNNFELDNWVCKKIHFITDSLGIERKNIHFVDYFPKWTYFDKNSDYAFHLDNDIWDHKEINLQSDVPCVLFDENWEENCLKYIFL